MANREEVVSQLSEMKGFLRGAISDGETKTYYTRVINNAIHLLEGGTILGNPSPLSKHAKKIRELI